MLDQSLIDWGSSNLSDPSEIALEASRIFPSLPNSLKYKTMEEAVQKAFLNGIHYWENTEEERATRLQWVAALREIVECAKHDMTYLDKSTLDKLDEWNVPYPTGWRSKVTK